MRLRRRYTIPPPARLKDQKAIVRRSWHLSSVLNSAIVRPVHPPERERVCWVNKPFPLFLRHDWPLQGGDSRHWS